MRLGLAVAAVLGPASARAAEGAEPSLSAGLLQTTLGLALIVALVLGAAWFLRRVSPAVGGATGPLRIVAARAVGQRERVVVIEIDEQWLVLGVAPGSVNAIATLPKGSLPQPAAAPSFATLLARATGRKSHE